MRVPFAMLGLAAQLVLAPAMQLLGSQRLAEGGAAERLAERSDFDGRSDGVRGLRGEGARRLREESAAPYENALSTRWADGAEEWGGAHTGALTVWAESID